MLVDRHAVLDGATFNREGDPDILTSAWRTAPPVDDLQQAAAREVDALIDDLEPTLDGHQRRLLHQLRLAAETLGAVRATVQMKRYAPI